MKVVGIKYSSRFRKQHANLPMKIRVKIMRAVDLFYLNAFHPLLRIHKLSGKLEGYWSISVDKKYRIIFEPLKNGEVAFNSVGTHAIYD